MIKYELKKIIRNKFIILIVLVLILPIFLNNPIIVNINLDGGIIDFVNDFRMISIFSVPLVVSIIFDENINKAESYPIFTQPISLLRILCSKLGVIIAIYIIAGGIGASLYSVCMKLSAASMKEILLLFKEFILVNIPIIIIMSIFSALVYSLIKNLVILYIAIFFGILLLGYCPVYFDFTLKNKEYQYLFMNGAIPDSFYLNRLCMIIEIFSLLLLLTLVYRNKVKKMINSIDIVGKCKRFGIGKKIWGKDLIMISPHITSFVAIILLFFVYSIFEKSASAWEFCQYLVVLLAGLIIIPSISEVYENKRSGYILTAAISRVNFLLQRIFKGLIRYWMICMVLFVIAYGMKIEIDFIRVFILLAGGTYLSMIGLTLSNLTKKTIIGYAAMLLCWGIFIIGGASFSEKLWFLSVPLAISTHSMVLWETLTSITIISSILLMTNIYIICRKESFSRVLLGVSIFLIAVNLLYLYPTISPVNRYFLKSNDVVNEKIGHFDVKYNSNLPRDSVIEITTTYDFLNGIFLKYLQLPDSKNELWILNKEQTSSIEGHGSYLYSYKTLNDFNPPKFSTLDNYFIKISNDILENSGISKEKVPEEIFVGVRNYLLYGKACADLDDLTTEEYREKYYVDTLSPEYSGYYKQKVKKSSLPEDQMPKLLFMIEDEYGIATVEELLFSLTQNKTEEWSFDTIIDEITRITGDESVKDLLYN